MMVVGDKKGEEEYGGDRGEAEGGRRKMVV